MRLRRAVRPCSPGAILNAVRGQTVMVISQKARSNLPAEHLRLSPVPHPLLQTLTSTGS